MVLEIRGPCLIFLLHFVCNSTTCTQCINIGIYDCFTFATKVATYCIFQFFDIDTEIFRSSTKYYHVSSFWVVNFFCDSICIEHNAMRQFVDFSDDSLFFSLVMNVDKWVFVSDYPTIFAEEW